MSVINMKGILVGVLATITMDMSTSILYKLQLIAPLHLVLMLQVTLMHGSVAQSPVCSTRQ